MAKTLIKLAWLMVVFLHWTILAANCAAVVFLISEAPWYIALPACHFIVWIGLSKVADCPLTALENWLRSQCGMQPIRTFLGHYVLGPVRRWRNRRARQRQLRQYNQAAVYDRETAFRAWQSERLI